MDTSGIASGVTSREVEANLGILKALLENGAVEAFQSSLRGSDALQGDRRLLRARAGWAGISPDDWTRRAARSMMISNLPTQLTRFIGREQEGHPIRQLLSKVRLLTLMGPGGSGKTRLAIEMAATLQDSYRDGITWIDLAALCEGDPVAQTATALGVRDQPGRALDQVLADYEHLVDACAALADSLLRACPNLQCLATSREPLGIPREVLRPTGRSAARTWGCSRETCPPGAPFGCRA